MTDDEGSAPEARPDRSRDRPSTADALAGLDDVDGLFVVDDGSLDAAPVDPRADDAPVADVTEQAGGRGDEDDDVADEAPDGGRSSLRNAVEWVVVVVGAIAIAVLVRTYVLQTFWIPSPSMAQTLVEDDRVLVNKLAYRFHDVNRGDVVVFERPANAEGDIEDLIKRVVALPGERVSIRDGVVWIDGARLEEPYTDGLPSEAKPGCGSADTTGIDTPEGMVVPEGHVFVMGDNRVNSTDGRCFGPIDEDLIVGRAFLIIWPPSKAGGL